MLDPQQGRLCMHYLRTAVHATIDGIITLQSANGLATALPIWAYPAPYQIAALSDIGQHHAAYKPFMLLACIKNAQTD